MFGSDSSRETSYRDGSAVPCKQEWFLQYPKQAKPSAPSKLSQQASKLAVALSPSETKGKCPSPNKLSKQASKQGCYSVATFRDKRNILSPALWRIKFFKVLEKAQSFFFSEVGGVTWSVSRIDLVCFFVYTALSYCVYIILHILTTSQLQTCRRQWPQKNPLAKPKIRRLTCWKVGVHLLNTKQREKI